MSGAAGLPEGYALSPAVPRDETVSRYATGNYSTAGYDDAGEDEDDNTGYAGPGVFTGDFLRGPSGANASRLGETSFAVSESLHRSHAAAWGDAGASMFSDADASRRQRSFADGGGATSFAADDGASFFGAFGGAAGDASALSASGYGGYGDADDGEGGIGDGYDEDEDASMLYDDGSSAPFVTTLQRRLLEQFAAVAGETSHESPFDDADRLTDLLVSHIEALRRKALLLPKARQQEVIAEIGQLKKERNTWALLGTVLRDRQEPADALGAPPAGPQTDRAILEDLQWRDPVLRWCAYVVQWLEFCSACDYQLIDARNYESVDVCLSRTLDYVNAMRNKPSEPSLLVKTLDPDAATRTDKRLQDADAAEQEQLLQKLIALVRVGDLARAKELCATAGQPWRAVTLGGGAAWHDPQLSDVAGAMDEVEGVGVGGAAATAQSGNWHRDLWKLNALHISQDASCSDRERVLYASLCGNLPVLREFFRSWEDLLWAHFSVLVDRRREQELRAQSSFHEAEHAALPEWYHETSAGPLTPHAVFAAVNEREPPSEPFHKIQQWLIMYCVDPDGGQEHLDGLVGYLRDSVAHADAAQQPLDAGRLRFFAHLVIFLRTIGLLPRRLKPVPRGAPLGADNERVAAGNAVIGAYVDRLTDGGHEPHYALIAGYTAELDARAQVERYTRFLRRFAGTDKRRMYLDFAEAAGLDVPAITKELVGREWRVDETKSRAEVAMGIDGGARLGAGVGGAGGAASGGPFASAAVGAGDVEGFAALADRPFLDESDKRKIQSLEWLTFHGSDRPEAIRQSNTAMRGFLSVGKIEAAKQVLGMLPYDSDAVAESQLGQRRFAFALEDELREYRAMRAFLEANDAFVAWDRRRSTPPLPLAPPGAAGDPGTGFLERQQAEEEHSRREARWEDEMNAAAQNAIAQVDAALGHVVSWCEAIEGLHLDFTFDAELGATESEDDIVAAAEEAMAGRVRGAVVWSGLYPEIEQGVVQAITWRVQLQPDDAALVDDDRRVAELVRELGRDRPLRVTVGGRAWPASAASLGRAGVVKRIRKLCVPALVENMHEVYHANGEHVECVRLAELVSTNSALFEAYRGNQARLAGLLGRIRASALKILEDRSMDPFGFPRLD